MAQQFAHYPSLASLEELQAHPNQVPQCPEELNGGHTAQVHRARGAHDGFEQAIRSARNNVTAYQIDLDDAHGAVHQAESDLRVLCAQRDIAQDHHQYGGAASSCWSNGESSGEALSTISRQVDEMSAILRRRQDRTDRVKDRLGDLEQRVQTAEDDHSTNCDLCCVAVMCPQCSIGLK